MTHVKDMPGQSGNDAPRQVGPYDPAPFTPRAMAPLHLLQHAPAQVRTGLRTARSRWLGPVLWVLASATQAQPTTAPAPSPERQQALVRMVRQDCGSCHGLRLTGGLGPALTAEALAGKPLDSMVATIYRGRPGTPMAPWSAMLSEQDALWIAQQLFAGFPDPPSPAKGTP